MAQGLLLIPISTNGASMRNVLNVLYSCRVQEKYGLPRFGIVTFLVTPDVKTVKLDGESLPYFATCQKLVSGLSPAIEIRCKPIANYAEDIPSTILSAVKENGKSLLIMDLTSGKKDITGMLYTAACISEISNMVYVDVTRNQETGEFRSLSFGDRDILDNVRITKSQTISEIENLASLNGMDFIIYRKSIEETIPDAQERRKSMFRHAVESYFRKQYRECIREVGLINEEVVQEVADRLQPLHDTLHEKHKGRYGKLTAIRNLQEDYEKLSNPRTESVEAVIAGSLKRFFDNFPALFEMLSALTNFRNNVSHSRANFEPERGDAKLAMDMMLHVLAGLTKIEKVVDDEK